MDARQPRLPWLRHSTLALLCALGGCMLPPVQPQPDTRPVAAADLGSAMVAGWPHGAIVGIALRGDRASDSNGDGIGDLRGLAQRLDALKALGIQGLWLRSVTVGADAAGGVAHPRRIDPAHGTMADFDELLHQAHQRGIGVLMDFAIDPDTLLRDPVALARQHDTLRHWLNRGVDGFRIDMAAVQAAPSPLPRPDEGERLALARGLRSLVAGYRHRHLVCDAAARADLRATAQACGSSFAQGLAGPLLGAAQGGPQAIAQVAAYFTQAAPTLATRLSPDGGSAGHRAVGAPAGDAAAHRLATATQLLLPGTPFIHEVEPASPANTAAAAQGPQPLRAHDQAMLVLRNHLTPIARGSYEAPQVQGAAFGFQRKLGDGHVLVLINYGREAATLRVSGLGAHAAWLNEHPAGGAMSRADAEGTIHFALAPQSVRVLQRQR